MPRGSEARAMNGMTFIAIEDELISPPLPRGQKRGSDFLRTVVSGKTDEKKLAPSRNTKAGDSFTVGA